MKVTFALQVDCILIMYAFNPKSLIWTSKIQWEMFPCNSQLEQRELEVEKISDTYSNKTV